MNLNPCHLLAVAVPAAVGATIATVMLVGSHGGSAPAARPPTTIVQRAAVVATDSPTPAAAAAPTDAPTAAPTSAPTAAPMQVSPTAAPTAVPTPDIWAGWTVGPDCNGCHMRWCGYSASNVYAMTSPSEPNAICTSTDNPASRAGAKGN
jgi:hypothetical protein